MLSTNFDPFPVLETPRLLLRRPETGDVDEIFRYRSDKEYMQYILHRYTTRREDVEDTIATIHRIIAASEGINWAITMKGNDTIIGMIGYVRFLKSNYRAEIGYMLHTPFHGQRITDEAMAAVMNYGFNTLQLHSIEAIVNCDNIASKKLLERNGFSNDAFFKDYLYMDGRFFDANVYSLLKS